MADLRDRTALVTGASSGIGAAMARELAGRGCHLVITARRKERLEALAADIREAHGVSVRALPFDLAEPGAPRRLYEEAAGGSEGGLDVLINNAGFGAYQRFADERWERHARLLQLNVASLVELSYAFVQDALEEDRRAWLLNVASVNALFPAPNFAGYNASKAFVLWFSESVAMELRRSNVSVTCVCPGATATEFSDVAGSQAPPAAQKTFMSAERCARIGLKGMLRGKRVVVTGFTNKLVAFLTRLLPRGAVGRAFARVIGEPPPPPSLTSGAASPSEPS